jgi:hypothetical protein
VFRVSFLLPVVCDLVYVAELVTEHCAPVTVRGVQGFLHALRASLDGSTMRGVGVIDVHIEERREGCPFGRRGDEDYGVTELHFGRAPRLDGAGGVEHGPKKRDRLVHVTDEDSWRDRAVGRRGQAARGRHDLILSPD